ncbi:MAG: amidohydrolase family protein [Gemmataceae bacterium]|nr:amidohydrolase family protein [Gemmataceae bacterium]MDW8243364.1 amidohydrolase family protein [Thermogemmata sp.]
MVTRYRARWIVSMDGPPLTDGSIAIDGQLIQAIDQARRSGEIDLGDVILLPGFINVHTHLDLTDAAECQPKGADNPEGFPAWLERVVAFRRKQSLAQQQAAVETGLTYSLQAGVTTLGDILTQPSLWSLLVSSPLRGVAFRELLGLTPDRAADAITELNDWLALQKEGRWHRGLSPHAPYSVRRELFVAAMTAAERRGCPLAIHLAESRAEAELLAQHQGPLVPFLERRGVWDPSGLIGSWEELLQMVPAEQRILWIHVNYLSPRCLSARQTIVHCPRTHAAFGHDPFPLESWQHKGVRVCLATDGLASNPDLNLLEEARWVYRHYPNLTADRVISMITREAAAAIGWEKWVGTLTPGKLADLVVIPWPSGVPLATDPCVAILEGSVSVQAVMIDGQWILPPAPQNG